MRDGLQEDTDFSGIVSPARAENTGKEGTQMTADAVRKESTRGLQMKPVQYANHVQVVGTQKYLVPTTSVFANFVREEPTVVNQRVRIKRAIV